LVEGLEAGRSPKLDSSLEDKKMNLSKTQEIIYKIAILWYNISYILNQIILMNFVISIIANSVGLYVASVIVPGVGVDPTIPLYYFLIAGLIFTIIFSIILPVVKVISFPIIILTLGLFSFVLNLVAFYALDQLLTGLEFSSILAMILTSIVISSINMLSNVFLR